MTSSLVGSEMCIRDRVKQASMPGNEVYSHSVVVRTPKPAPACLSVAVSYTHLTLPTICSV
eukprot:10806946-Prorocentrum_lima.AAC.1